MTRALTATLSALCIVGSLALPALADDSSATVDTASAKSVDAGSTGDSKTAIADKSGAETDSDKKAIADNTKDPAKDPAKPAKAKSGGSNTDLATRLASFAVCSVVGAPIAVVRRTGIEIVQGERDLIGDTDTWYKKAMLVFPGFISVPYGAISGGIGGAVYSLKNAWVGSGDEPFGKEAFSLGDIGN